MCGWAISGPVVRLVATLGQALVYATANGDQLQAHPALDHARAADAVCGLGLAIVEAGPGDQVVRVDAEIIDRARTTLEAFRDQLQTGRWTTCPCGENHGRTDTDGKVLKLVQDDLLLLPSRV